GWSAGNEEDTRKYVAELVALAPNVIFAAGSAAVGPLHSATRTVPIVFVTTPDPVGAGFVDSLARPGGNTTGFTPYEYGIGAKWLELLKQIVPRVTRVAVLRGPEITAGIGLWGAIQSVSPSFGVELRPVDVRDATEMERACGLRRKPEWRSDTDREPVGDHSPRSDHCACGTAPAARDLL